MNDSAQLGRLIRGEKIAFTGERGEFFRLVRRGALLELITAGFYRFWLSTDIRRSLWANTSIDGDTLEYTGTAKELFVGFLFALAILVPVYLIYFLIGILASHPLTEDRHELMRREDRPATGPEILSDVEWEALKAICRPAKAR